MGSEAQQPMPHSGNGVHPQQPALATMVASLRSAYIGRANGAEVHPRDASGAPRRSGAPVAAMHEVLTLSVCKRRDAVRLARVEPARPAGAASGVSSGATSSWTARSSLYG